LPPVFWCNRCCQERYSPVKVFAWRYLLGIRQSLVLTVTGLRWSSAAAASQRPSRRPRPTSSCSYSKSCSSLAVNPQLCKDHHVIKNGSRERHRKNDCQKETNDGSRLVCVALFGWFLGLLCLGLLCLHKRPYCKYDAN
jgi:hypothetical protein